MKRVCGRAEGNAGADLDAAPGPVRPARIEIRGTAGRPVAAAPLLDEWPGRTQDNPMTSGTIDWREAPPADCRHGALAIGNFDGVHLGHAALLAELARQARAAGGPAVALTFDPHPLAVLRPEAYLPALTTLPER